MVQVWIGSTILDSKRATVKEKLFFLEQALLSAQNCVDKPNIYLAIWTTSCLYEKVKSFLTQFPSVDVVELQIVTQPQYSNIEKQYQNIAKKIMARSHHPKEVVILLEDSDLLLSPIPYSDQSCLCGVAKQHILADPSTGIISEEQRTARSDNILEILSRMPTEVTNDFSGSGIVLDKLLEWITSWQVGRNFQISLSDFIHELYGDLKVCNVFRRFLGGSMWLTLERYNQIINRSTKFLEEYQEIYGAL